LTAVKKDDILRAVYHLRTNKMLESGRKKARTWRA